MTKPTMTSKRDMRFRDTKGSMKLVNKVVTDKHPKVTETLDTLMAWKKQIQWTAMTMPMAASLPMSLMGRRKLCLRRMMMNTKAKMAIMVRYQTSS